MSVKKKLSLYRFKGSKWIVLLVVIVLLFCIFRHETYHKNEGVVFGTTYHITYEYNSDLHEEIITELKKVDATLSMFNDTSIVARINRNENPPLHAMFSRVFNRAMEVSKATNGAFDITVAPLVNAWGFGFEKSGNMNKQKVDSLLQYVGYRKVHIVNGRIEKENPNVRLDFSAIAKGYGVDVVADYLESKGVHNFMVEIGGEVVVKGVAPKHDDSDSNKSRLWRIGINKPVEDSLNVDQSLQGILQLTDCGMATSGNYRNFYYKDGKRYAHTIDPHTGYPVQHTLLSTTVLASDCMTADAYATAFMVMGLEKAQALVLSQKALEAYFIYTDRNGVLRVWMSPGMERNVTKR